MEELKEEIMPYAQYSQNPNTLPRSHYYQFGVFPSKFPYFLCAFLLNKEKCNFHLYVCLYINENMMHFFFTICFYNLEMFSYSLLWIYLILFPLIFLQEAHLSSF